MNKLILLVLAICVISAHAFVKREVQAGTGAAENDWLKDVQNQFQAVLRSAQEKASEAFNPDDIKKTLNSLVDNFDKTIKDLKANTEKQN